MRSNRRFPRRMGGNTCSVPREVSFLKNPVPREVSLLKHPGLDSGSVRLASVPGDRLAFRSPNRRDDEERVRAVSFSPWSTASPVPCLRTSLAEGFPSSRSDGVRENVYHQGDRPSIRAFESHRCRPMDHTKAGSLCFSEPENGYRTLGDVIWAGCESAADFPFMADGKGPDAGAFYSASRHGIMGPWPRSLPGQRPPSAQCRSGRKHRRRKGS